MCRGVVFYIRWEISRIQPIPLSLLDSRFSLVYSIRAASGWPGLQMCYGNIKE